LEKWLASQVDLDLLLGSRHKAKKALSSDIRTTEKDPCPMYFSFHIFRQGLIIDDAQYTLYFYSANHYFAYQQSYFDWSLSCKYPYKLMETAAIRKCTLRTVCIKMRMCLG
jgi:hypothetical protein